MSVLLVALAVAAALNPARIAVAARGDRRGVLFAAGFLFLVSIVVAWISGPINDLIGISVSSSVIAAGVALVVIGARDALISPPSLSDSPTSVPAALFPLFFPTMFTPAIALVALAGGAERGVAPAAVAILAGICASGYAAIGLKYEVVTKRPNLVRVMATMVGLGAAAVGVLVATHGVMSI